MPTPDRIRVVAISDLHAGRAGRLGFIQSTFTDILKQNPDVILVGGDFIDTSVQDAHLLAPQLRRFQSQHIPLVGVLGNHDHWPGEGKEATHVRNILETQGSVHILDGEVYPFQKNGYRLDILGVEGYSEGSELKNGMGVYKDRRAIPGKTLVDTEVLKLRRGLTRMRGNFNIVLMHYTPGNNKDLPTLQGEQETAKSRLGSPRFLREIVQHNKATKFPISHIFHGHADFGYPNGRKEGMTIYNVSAMARGRRGVLPYQIVDFKLKRQQIN